MKIFNIENGKEKIYVQKKDIKQLWKFCGQIPLSIFNNENNDIEMDEFIEFDFKEEIDFFKEQEWIIDYRKIIKLSKEELEEYIKELQNKMNYFREKHSNAKNEIEKVFIMKEYNSLENIINDVKIIYSSKINKTPINLPTVPDYLGFSLENDDKNYPYKLCISLDPNKYLLFRTDEKQLSTDDTILDNFIQTGLSLSLIDKCDSIPSKGQCNVIFEYNENKTNLIIKVDIIDRNEIKKETIEKQKEKGIKKFIKSLFKRYNNLN